MYPPASPVAVAVLRVLIEHPALRHNPYACELVSRFNEKVWMHLVFEENTIYAELARHVFASGDWVTPRLNGILYFEKPPLQYWMTAAA